MKFALATMNPLEEVLSKKLFSFGGFVFTNHMVMVALAASVLLIVLPLSCRKVRLVRHGFGNAIETICVFFRNEVVRPFLKEQTDKYVPVIWTLFFFILSMNLLGMIPLDKIIYIFTGEKNHIVGAATGNIFVTGALALFSFIFFHAAGILENGVGNYIRNFCPKVPGPIYPLIFLLEVLSSFIRMFSLAVRLFANLFAGHMMLAVILGFIFFFKNILAATVSISFAALISMLELFVAFLQAYIFAFLTTIYIGMAIHQDH
ncbi:F0F1 ATP synthase subunit A [Sedimentisphaera salicampi]|uniref:ATP synthase subunit a n=1 Tax=Sedimentisphaera salicampi TaxID=1941349 RepID=A0A1W6LK56_9BACT|nr:F0F1 ATP synthase subunit A [Sedimentisphaera salicampi]ARN56132.1 F-ATPase subunit 6 [Sedimentisphaera salicampi]